MKNWNVFSMLLWILALVLLWFPVSGQSFVQEPPSRGYGDCGSFAHRMKENNGKCGICGDIYSNKMPRAHELGGLFGKGDITRTYNANAIIPIEVDLTEIFLPDGFIEFSVGKEPNATQERLDENVLKIEGSNDTKFYPSEGIKVYKLNLRLPEDLECKHCVLQARYVGGSNWGSCINGSYGMGCGQQEEFRACADITIKYSIITMPLWPPLVSLAKPTRSLSIPEESTFGSSWQISIVIVSCGVLASVMLLLLYLIKRKYDSSRSAPPLANFSPSDKIELGNILQGDSSRNTLHPPIVPPRIRYSPSKERNYVDSLHNNRMNDSSSTTLSYVSIPQHHISRQMEMGTVHDHLSKTGIKINEKHHQGQDPTVHWVNDIKEKVVMIPQQNRKDKGIQTEMGTVHERLRRKRTNNNDKHDQEQDTTTHEENDVLEIV